MKSELTITDGRLQITRIFEAPRDVVFGCWKQAEKMQQWSGCKEATHCEIEMDFRVGGSFTQKMHMTHGGDFSFTGKYEEIVEPERIVYNADLGFATTRVVVEFFEQGSHTKMVLTQEGFPNEFFCKTVSQGTMEGLDKLDQLLVAQAV